MTQPSYIHTNNTEFQFIYILACYCLLLLFVVVAAILVGVKSYLSVDLLCCSLVINDVKHLFVYLLAICISSLQKCLFKLFAHNNEIFCHAIRSSVQNAIVDSCLGHNLHCANQKILRFPRFLRNYSDAPCILFSLRICDQEI